MRVEPDQEYSASQDNMAAEDVVEVAADTVGGHSEQPAFAPFESLTLAEITGLLLRAPVRTLRSLVKIARSPSDEVFSGPAQAEITLTHEQHPALLAERPSTRRITLVMQRGWVQVSLYFIAVLLAFSGAYVFVSGYHRFGLPLAEGGPYFLAALLLWLVAEIYGDWPGIRGWMLARREPDDDGPANRPGAVSVHPHTAFWLGVHPIRVFAALGTIVFALLAWIGTAGNQWRFIGFWGWVMSIILVVIALAPISWNPWRWLPEKLSKRTRVTFRVNWTFMILLIIMVVGTYFRLYDLRGMPPEMTSDHIEKLLDANRIRNGEYPVFFPNNGGREGFQMYAMAALASVPGLGINYSTLKLLTVLEGLVTLPVLWWLGREVIGPRDRRLGNILGLVLAALVAVSYWHLMLSRLALRIVLTPLVASLLLIFLGRGMRSNHRGDFIAAGLVLGFGLYMYQAVRMLPVVVLVGVGLAMLAQLRNRRALMRYTLNLAALVLVAFVVFVPLFRFSTDYPEHFWMRTAGRILGDSPISTVTADGSTVTRDPTFEEWRDAFVENMSILGNNIYDALWMFNWRGDVAWINGVPSHPVMDMFAGGLLVLGLLAWIVYILRHPDPVSVMVPVMLFIMLLPSALAIAMPLENPSASRSSGSLPLAYMLAAFPLSVIVNRIWAISVRWSIRIVAAGMVTLVALGSYSVNFDLYYNEYREVYAISSLPHSDPGRILRGFAMSDGAYGNAFIIAYPYWWDHRIVGLEAGIIDWTNTIPLLEEAPDRIHNTHYCPETAHRLDSERDLLFFYNLEDEAAAEQLREWFPEGRATLIGSYQMDGDFFVYRVPALGIDGFEAFSRQFTRDPRCPL